MNCLAEEEGFNVSDDMFRSVCASISVHVGYSPHIVGNVKCSVPLVRNHTRDLIKSPSSDPIELFPSWLRLLPLHAKDLWRVVDHERITATAARVNVEANFKVPSEFMSQSSSDPEGPTEHSLRSKEEDGPSRKPRTDDERVRGRSMSSENSARTTTTTTSSSGNDPRNVISFPPGDPENPYNWSSTKKIRIVVLGVVLVINSTFGSSVASGTPVEVSEYFQNDNQYHLVLPISIYLVGYVLGPLAFGPLSESYGRKWVMIGTFALFTGCTFGCALAPTFAAYIVFRFLVGVGASSPISVVGGIYADIYEDPVTRGRAMSIFMAATTWGPLIGPITSGFASPALGWRWVYWIALILAGASWPMLLLSPETYSPVILQRRAARMRKEQNDPSIMAPLDLEPRSLSNLLTVVLTRPVRMFLFEALVLFSCLYLAFAYAIFYMFFQAYPLIYPAIYGFNYGQTGLAFLPVGVGAILACVIYLGWDVVLQHAKDRNAPWSQVEEYRRLPLACVGGPLFVISLLWLGWSAREDVHWIVPVMSALPFGTGFLFLFMALLNYLVDAYDEYAASATAAAACSRSLFGAVLPFAARPMYETLGVDWACTLLGGLSLALCIIPFAFLKYGGWLRERSKFCQELAKLKEDRRRRESTSNSNSNSNSNSTMQSARDSQERRAEEGRTAPDTAQKKA